MMEYKGYQGHVEYDDEAKIFHGEVIGLKDVITFQGESVSELEAAFKDSIDDYLDWCAKRGEPPERPYSGKFMLRIPPELHAASTKAAQREGVSLNEFTARALKAQTRHLRM